MAQLYGMNVSKLDYGGFGDKSLDENKNFNKGLKMKFLTMKKAP